MPEHCAFRAPNGKFCRRWPIKGTRFCLGHTTVEADPASESQDIDNLSPLDRLNTHDDVFDVVRETLNAIRLGRVSPGRAYATGYFVDLWLRVRERMEKVGLETKKFQKRRRMSDAVEQATFDMVAEKVVQVITGRTIEEIELEGGQVTRPGEPHWTQRPLSVIDEMLGARGPRTAPAPPSPCDSAPTGPCDPSPQFPLPKNWGYEKEEKFEVKGGEENKK